MAAKNPEALRIAAMLSKDRAAELGELAALKLPRSERDIPLRGEDLRDLLGLQNGPILGFVKKRLWEYNVCHPDIDREGLIQEALRIMEDNDI